MIIVVAVANSQDCNSYLRRASELVSQQKYCEAKMYYQRYSNCDADADVSTEIAMCERRCKIQTMEDGGNDVAGTTGRDNVNRNSERNEEGRVDRNLDRDVDQKYYNRPVSRAKSSYSSKFNLGFNGGLFYPTKKEEGEERKYLYFGGGISAEFLPIKNIGIGLSAGYYGFEVKNVGEGITRTATLIPLNLTNKFYILTKSVKPYIGVDGGYFIFGGKKKFEGTSVSGSESFWGIAPNIGLQFKLSKALALDINGKYNYFFSKTIESIGINIKPIDMIGINMGLVVAF